MKADMDGYCQLFINYRDKKYDILGKSIIKLVNLLTIYIFFVEDVDFVCYNDSYR